MFVFLAAMSAPSRGSTWPPVERTTWSHGRAEHFKHLPPPSIKRALAQQQQQQQYVETARYLVCNIDDHVPVGRLPEKKNRRHPPTRAYTRYERKKKKRTFSLSLLKAFSCSAGGSLLCQTAQHLLITSSTLLGLSCRHFRVLHASSAGKLSRSRLKKQNAASVKPLLGYVRRAENRTGGQHIIFMKQAQHQLCQRKVNYLRVNF